MSHSLLARLHSYYDSLESRIGYRLVLGGTRHFGYYDSEDSSPWAVNTALRRMEAQLMSTLGCTKGQRVLDAGCGVGHVAIFMAREAGFNIEAIDVTPHHVVKAKRNVQAAGLSHQISVQEADYHNLKMFEDNSFDGIYTMETFVHAREPRKVLQEFFRILKPSGRLALTEYDHERPNPSNQKFIKHITLLNDATSMPGFQSYQTGDIGILLSETGFQDVKTNDLSENIAPMLWLFQLLATIPYFFLWLFGIEWLFPNTSSGALGYKFRKNWRYIQVSGSKPRQ